MRAELFKGETLERVAVARQLWFATTATATTPHPRTPQDVSCRRSLLELCPIWTLGHRETMKQCRPDAYAMLPLWTALHHGRPAAGPDAVRFFAPNGPVGRGRRPVLVSQLGKPRNVLGEQLGRLRTATPVLRQGEDWRKRRFRQALQIAWCPLPRLRTTLGMPGGTGSRRIASRRGVVSKL